MANFNIVNIYLQRPNPATPWGFRIQGGADTGHPVFIQRVTPGTIASHRLSPGDVILQIRGIPTNQMRYVEADHEINKVECSIELTVQKRIPLGYEDEEQCMQRQQPTNVQAQNLWGPVSNNRMMAPNNNVVSPNQGMSIMKPKSPAPANTNIWADPSSGHQDKYATSPSPMSPESRWRNQSNVPQPPPLPSKAGSNVNNCYPQQPNNAIPSSQIWQNQDSQSVSPPKAPPPPAQKETYPKDNAGSTPKSSKIGPAGGIAVFPGMVPKQNFSPPATPTEETPPTPEDIPPAAPSGPPVVAPGPPPPPPPPPPPGNRPTWRETQDAKAAAANKEAEKSQGYHPSQNCASKPSEGSDKPFSYLPSQLELTNALQKKDKKPFTYTPTGLDLSQIKSQRMQNRIINNISDKYTVQSNDAQSEANNKKLSNLQNTPSQAPNSYNAPNQVLTSPPPPPPKRSPQPNRKIYQNNQPEAGIPIGYQRVPPQSNNLQTFSSPNPVPNFQTVENSQQHKHPQSRSFKILQLMTGDDDDDEVPEPRQPPPPPKRNDETRFSGVRNNDPVPSKSFHRLQKMTDDFPSNQSQQQDNQVQPQDEVLDEARINPRYKGKNIPSRSFKMLQEITGGEVDDITPPSQKKMIQNEGVVPARKFSNVPPSEQEVEAEPKKYTGGSIPSRSFRMLQYMTGEDPDDSPGEGVTDF